mgnify:CR=1 FL=1
MFKFRYFHQYCLGVVMLTALTSINATPIAANHHHAATKPAAEVTLPRVDINHADVATLSQVKGISAKRAQEIIAWRQQHGHFNSVDDLLKVKGFSSKRLKGTRNQLVAS